jgi:hypothetical protein
MQLLWYAAQAARQRLRQTFRDSIRPNKELTLNLPSNVRTPAPHRLPIGQKNTLPRNHVAARALARDALQQAYRMLQELVQTNSFVMAYSECFLAIGVILIIGSAMIWPLYQD